jgi:hypothetical protein
MKQIGYFVFLVFSIMTLSINTLIGQTKKELIVKVQELNNAQIKNDVRIENLERTVKDLTLAVAKLEVKLDAMQSQNQNQNQNITSNVNPPTNHPAVHTQVQPITAPRSQCLGITKAGNRCKRSGGSNGYCYQHGPN